MIQTRFFAGFFALLFLISGCATAPKRVPVAGPDARDGQIAQLKNELEEQKVSTAEAEARAAKAENDLREREMTKVAPAKDPYLK